MLKIVDFLPEPDALQICELLLKLEYVVQSVDVFLASVQVELVRVSVVEWLSSKLSGLLNSIVKVANHLVLV